MTAEQLDQPPVPRPRPAIELTEGECWHLLGTVSLGRVVFTQRAMPAIRPVNHLIEERKIIIRTHLGAAIAAPALSGTLGEHGKPFGSVVCYEADEIDSVRHTGWSVIATGLARLVTDPALVKRYSDGLTPWIAGELNQVVEIEPRFINGVRLVGWCT
jgi:Pyridoxamine 5'-phosphate oxidase